MRKTHLMTAPAAAVLCALALSGCTGSAEPSPPVQEDEQRTSLDVGYSYIVGDSRPGSLTIVCVEGSAFLYAYSSETTHTQGGPALARFPEQDASCSPVPAEEQR